MAMRVETNPLDQDSQAPQQPSSSAARPATLYQKIMYVSYITSPTSAQGPA